MRRLALPLLAAFALSACDRMPDPTFDARVRAYILEHPEVLEEAMTRLQQSRQADTNRAVVQAVRANRQAIERDPRDYVANPEGRVTVTQFYDYRCSHCITAAPQVLALIAERPDVRFVFKELPIFGSTSDRAARLALRVHREGGDTLALYRAMMSARPLDDAAVDRIAVANGVAPATLDTPAPTDARHLAAVRTLADTLRIDGTPTFIVGERVIPGADMAALREAVGPRA